MVQVQEKKGGNAVVAGGAGAIAGAGTFTAVSNALGKKVADVVQNAAPEITQFLKSASPSNDVIEDVWTEVPDAAKNVADAAKKVVVEVVDNVRNDNMRSATETSKGMGGNIRDVAANGIVAFKNAGVPRQIAIVGLTAAAATTAFIVVRNLTKPKDTITAPAEHQGLAVGLEHGKTR